MGTAGEADFYFQMVSSVSLEDDQKCCHILLSTGVRKVNNPRPIFTAQTTMTDRVEKPGPLRAVWIVH